MVLPQCWCYEQPEMQEQDPHMSTIEAAKPKTEVSPLLKLVLELGPLMVFFFANSRGDWLASRFPALAR
jgi:intracellular septation protein